MTDKPVSNRPHLIVAAGILVLAGVSVWQSLVIPRAALYAAVGPEVAPWAVTALLALFGTLLLIDALKGGWAADQDGTLTERSAFLTVLAGLLANLVLIDFAGFILASTVMFTLVARGFGSVRPVRDAAIGFALAFVAYVGFDRVLGYKIGTGWIEALI